jgi:DNA processing protein
VTDTDRAARAFLLTARPPDEPAVRALVAEHGAPQAAELVAASAGAAGEPDATEAAVWAQSERLRLIIPTDDEWPPAFHTWRSAPLGLWARGDARLSDITRQAVAVLGGTVTSPYGQQMAAELGAGLASAGWTPLTLGRPGADSGPLRASAEARAPAVALPLGRLIVPRPRAHHRLFRRVRLSGGLLVSQHGTRPPDRRADVRGQATLLVALAAALVLVEPTDHRIEALCARLAHEAGRPVFALPGPVNYPGSEYAHELIRNGRARLFTRYQHVLAELQGESKP